MNVWRTPEDIAASDVYELFEHVYTTAPERFRKVLRSVLETPTLCGEPSERHLQVQAWEQAGLERLKRLREGGVGAPERKTLVMSEGLLRLASALCQGRYERAQQVYAALARVREQAPVDVDTLFPSAN